jgi:hypothetical protein
MVTLEPPPCFKRTTLASWGGPVILATLKAEIGRIAVKDQPGKKVCEIPSQQKNAGLIDVCLSSQQHRKHKQEDLSLGINARPYSKNI